MDFLSGIILGAIAGVIIDRLYKSYFEKIPRVRVASSCSYGLEGQRFNLGITNLGSEPLPPYDVVLHHPDGGYLRCFQKTQASERLPRQEEVFTFKYDPAHPNAESNYQATLRWLTFPRQDRQQMSDEDFKNWRLELHLIHSKDVVLFEDAQAGAAIAEIIRGILESKQLNPTGDQMWRAHAENTWTIKGRRLMAIGRGKLRSLRNRLAGIARPKQK